MERESGGQEFEAAVRAAGAYGRLREEIAKVIVGQKEVVDELLIALFAGGHCLLLGVPGLAKTLLVRTLASSLDLSFQRIQFTPDLMPADVTGAEILSEGTDGRREFRFVRGPVFANVLLADEINRTPPRTQSALLEAMEERQVTVAGEKHPLPSPFFVLATQNPIEQEGTYPLPEAQLDRFMFEVVVDYPDAEDEFEIVRRTTSETVAAPRPALTVEAILEAQRTVRAIPCPEPVMRYAVAITRATRPKDSTAPDFVRKCVSWGAGPRASQHLVLAAKTRAMLMGRIYVDTEDVRAVAKPVFRHRLLTNYEAESAGLTADALVERLIASVPSPDAPPGGFVAALKRFGEAAGRS